MTLKTEFVIHFGYPVSSMIYDHNLGQSIWKQILTYFDTHQSQLYQKVQNNQKYQSYSIRNLTYLFDLSSTRCNANQNNYECWSENIDCVNLIKIKNALTYQRQRTYYQYPFQPINTYFNVHQFICHQFKYKSFSFVFVQKEKTYEIMIVFDGSYQQFISNQKDADFLSLLDNILSILSSNRN